MTRPDIEAIKGRLSPMLVVALRTQRQADMDGVMVEVSRQACDEAADFLENDAPACLEYIERLEAENERLRKVEREANLLLTWTYQHAIKVDAMPEQRGWWHVSDLHPGIYNAMNSAERDLYIALGGSEAPAALKGETNAG